MAGQAEPLPAEALWQDYVFLTREMAKFTDRQEWEMLETLIDQRTGLQRKIEARADRAFIDSQAGRQLFLEIRRIEGEIRQKLHLMRNQALNQQRVARAYDAFSAIPAGSLMNRGT